MQNLDKLIIMFVMVVVLVGLVNAIDTGIDGEIGIDLIPTTPLNYSTVNVNNSEYLQGYTPNDLGNLFSGAIDSNSWTRTGTDITPTHSGDNLLFEQSSLNFDVDYDSPSTILFTNSHSNLYFGISGSLAVTDGSILNGNTSFNSQTYPYSFWVNDTARFSDKVTIGGTQEPTHELNVIGDVNITEDLFVSGDIESFGDSYFWGETSFYGMLQPWDEDFTFFGNLNPESDDYFSLGNSSNRWRNANFSGNITADYIYGDGSSLTGLAWTRNGTNVFLTNSGDKVGIGRTNPQQTLHVEGALIARTYKTNITGYPDIFDADSTNHYLKSPNNLYIQTNTATSTNTAMTILANGYVGVGLTTPNKKLHFHQNDGTDSRARFTNADTGAGGSDGFLFGLGSNEAGYLWNYENTPIFFGTNGATRMYLSAEGYLGKGTISPSYPLEVAGSVSGITAYFQNNISAEDYLYHSPFTKSTPEEALNEVLLIKGVNGKIDHTTLPSDTVTILDKPIYEETITQEERVEQIAIMEDITYEQEVCDYVSTSKDKYDYVCSYQEVTEERQKQNCINETKYDYEKPIVDEIELDYYTKIPYTEEVCTPVYENITTIENITTSNQIGTEEEPQTSVGMLISKLILSVQQLFEKDVELENQLNKYEECLTISKTFEEYKECLK